jgi:hypothetical protein
MDDDITQITRLGTNPNRRMDYDFTQICALLITLKSGLTQIKLNMIISGLLRVCLPHALAL